jgi:hypothetical protein
MKSLYSKTYPDLISGRYFSTVWCTLEENAFPVIHNYLNNIVQNCDWLCTFGDASLDSKFMPHISLRYLGFTDELDKSVIISNIDVFTIAIKNGINNSKNPYLELGEVKLWERLNGSEVVVSRLSWSIKDDAILRSIHSELLKISGFQLIQNLESQNYNPHISLGQVNLTNNNHEIVTNFLKNNKLEDLKVKISNFAINYATPTLREEFQLDIK